MTDAEMALRERIMGELIACYGEGEDTDWSYLNDLCELIVSMIERERAASMTEVAVPTSRKGHHEART